MCCKQKKIMSLIQIFIGFSVISVGYQSVKTKHAIVCDLSHHLTSCRPGYCCARDEFILEDVLCKPLGKLHDVCTTTHSESECPCLDGLYCKSDVQSSQFVSVYGRCHNRSIDIAPSTTTVKPETTTHNSPPVIHNLPKTILVSTTTEVSTRIVTFTVSDKDKGSKGVVTCKLLRTHLFLIEKLDRRKYTISVSSSLITLLPQTLSVYIDCSDDGVPPSNNLAILNVKFFIDDTLSHATISTRSSSTSKSSEVSTDSTTLLASAASTPISTRTNSTLHTILGASASSTESTKQHMTPITTS